MTEPLLTDTENTQQGRVEKTGVGPIVSTVVVVVLIVIGGIYFFVHQAAKLRQVQAAQGVNS